MNKVFTKKIKTFDNAKSGLDETIFHNANGYIGVRGTLEEGVPAEWDTMRGMYINGFYEVIPMKQAENLCNFVDKKETMLNVCDTQTIKLNVNGLDFSLLTGKTLSNERTLDMEAGITSRAVRWQSPRGDKISLNVKRMTSFEELSLFTQEYSVTAENFDGELVVSSLHLPEVYNYSDPNDPRLAADSEQFLHCITADIKDSISYTVTETAVSKLRCAVLSAHALDAKRSRVCVSKTDDNTFIYNAVIHINKGETITLTKYTIITDSLRFEDPLKTGFDKLSAVLKNGIAYYYEKQRRYLTDFWSKAMMEIQNDNEMSLAVNFNMYQLLQSATKDSFGNIAAKGLSGEGYEGHYFWDTEMFMLPFFVLTNPRLAKQILKYRYQTLDKARENARLLGHKKGALFPWRTITGVECSGYYPSGTCQYHIDGDIAYAIINYYLVTGDLDFIKDYGAEILLESARLWLDVGFFDKDRFVINMVTGPDEYTCMVNNNYYTNMVAKYNLEWAVKFIKLLDDKDLSKALRKKLKLTDEELTTMSEASHKMFLPFSEELGVIPQDDSFFDKPVWDLKKTPKSDFPLLLHYHPLHLYRYQVCKQADTVMAFLLFPECADKDIMKRSFEYYENITTHDSSLSKCAFSVVAARLGMRDKAYSYFGNSAKLDLMNLHHNTKDGIHTANMGGCYMSVVYGFAGLSITEEGCFLNPFLPDKWEGYTFKFGYMGSVLKVEVDQTNVKISLEDGDDVSVNLYGKLQKITKKTPAKAPLQ
ncbi:MAG: glycoside hydrolase family 65 protein [Lachnospiraceae bacterium]|nr:glycoside hydrolase family 65 protein [Lachnospiraceae bacterium]